MKRIEVAQKFLLLGRLLRASRREAFDPFQVRLLFLGLLLEWLLLAWLLLAWLLLAWFLIAWFLIAWFLLAWFLIAWFLLAWFLINFGCGGGGLDGVDGAIRATDLVESLQVR